MAFSGVFAYETHNQQTNEMRVRFPLPAIDPAQSTRDFARRNRAPSKSLGPR
jgi:hypothetical protein